MKLTIKLFATLRQGRGKVLELEMDKDCSVSKILNLLEIKQEDVAILLINGRDGALDTKLVENDTVSLFPPVGGG